MTDWTHGPRETLATAREQGRREGYGQALADVIAEYHGAIAHACEWSPQHVIALRHGLAMVRALRERKERGDG